MRLCSYFNIKIHVCVVMMQPTYRKIRFTAILCILMPCFSGGTEMCRFYRRTQDNLCAHQCIEPFVGPCPRWVPTSIGMLQEGTCENVGYPIFVKNISIFAGPCGNMEFSLFSPVKETNDKENTPYLHAIPTEVLVPRVIGIKSTQWHNLKTLVSGLGSKISRVY